MSKDIYSVNWLDLIPPSIVNDPQVQAISAAVTPQLQEVSQSIRECIILARLDELQEEVVDLLAWQYHVDFYDAELSITQKRNLVRTSIDAHRHKGTPYAVELVVKAIFEEAIVQEWFEYGGEPYHFKIDVRDDTLQSDTVKRLIRAINTVKNTRSWLETIIVRLPIVESVVTIHNRLQFLLHNNTKQSYWGNRRRYYPLDGCVLLDGSITLGDWMELQDLNGNFLLDGTSLLDGYTQYGTNEHHNVRFKMDHAVGSKITPTITSAATIALNTSSDIRMKSSAIFHAIRNYRYSMPIEIRQDIGALTNYKAKTVLRRKVSNQYLNGEGRLDGHLRLDGQELHESILFKSITNHETERIEVL
ncbi:phage tail protein I [Pelosinus baikalensis]|uniref:Phage tail protein I n=1 Tax=Pelosinus baikalensis TaxID=2892015 RepID=A0ABS8HWT1_9FIRM|nr:phage tail protein I [Pelosinus baikalensis]MCC5467615.1 phage tail protein I [Pelosinus baikalensis]